MLNDQMSMAENLVLWLIVIGGLISVAFVFINLYCMFKYRVKENIVERVGEAAQQAMNALYAPVSYLIYSDSSTSWWEWLLIGMGVFIITGLFKIFIIRPLVRLLCNIIKIKDAATIETEALAKFHLENPHYNFIEAIRGYADVTNYSRKGFIHLENHYSRTPAYFSWWVGDEQNIKFVITSSKIESTESEFITDGKRSLIMRFDGENDKQATLTVDLPLKRGAEKHGSLFLYGGGDSELFDLKFDFADEDDF